MEKTKGFHISRRSCAKTLLLLSVQNGCDDRQQNRELFLKCSKCLQAGHWGSWKLCVSGVEMQGAAEGA